VQSPGGAGITAAPGGSNTTATGTGISPGTTTGSNLNTSGLNQPGVPNTSTPGSIGTDASPSGLPGDSTSAPGYPAKVGQ
jgi:hypothetical protein